mmetsp:Transcript_15049/g.19728  ORF Transcript_15049/g.19728 Transcript_15049/m.19728 type:complete len:305 (-) Transcript_15049:178-1092(-)
MIKFDNHNLILFLRKVHEKSSAQFFQHVFCAVRDNIELKPSKKKVEQRSEDKEKPKENGKKDGALLTIELTKPASLGLSLSADTEGRGIQVMLIQETAPASVKDKFEVGDIIADCNGKATLNPDAFEKCLKDVVVDANVVFTVIRKSATDETNAMETESSSQDNASKETEDPDMIELPEDENGPAVKLKLGDTKVLKEFPGHGMFTGTIISQAEETKLYNVVYEDGDSEEMPGKELKVYILAHQKQNPPPPSQPTTESKDSQPEDIVPSIESTQQQDKLDDSNDTTSKEKPSTAIEEDHLEVFF